MFLYTMCMYTPLIIHKKCIRAHELTLRQDIYEGRRERYSDVSGSKHLSLHKCVYMYIAFRILLVHPRGGRSLSHDIPLSILACLCRIYVYYDQSCYEFTLLYRAAIDLYVPLSLFFSFLSFFLSFFTVL